MAVDRSPVQQRLAVFSWVEYLLQGVLDDIEIRTLTYEPDTRALLIEYTNDTTDTTDLTEEFHQRVLAVGTACASSLQDQHWPADFEHVRCLAYKPGETDPKTIQALRWSAPIEWLKHLTVPEEDIPDTALTLTALDTIEAVYPDGRVEPIDPVDELEE